MTFSGCLSTVQTEDSWQLDQLTAASTSGTCPRRRWRRSCQENTGGTLITHRNHFTVDLEQIQGNQHANRLMLSAVSCRRQVRGQSDESVTDVFYRSFHGSSVPTAQLSAPCPGLRLGGLWSAWTGVAWPCCGATSEHTHTHTCSEKGSNYFGLRCCCCCSRMLLLNLS